MASARQLRQLVADLHRAGTTIFLTTHYIEEAERLCDRIAFLVSGRIVRTEAVEHLLQPLQAKHVVQIAYANSLHGIQSRLSESFPNLEFAIQDDGVIRVEADAPIRVGSLVRFLEEGGVEVTEARRMRPSLEDVFVSITGIEAEAMRKEKEKGGRGGGE